MTTKRPIYWTAELAAAANAVFLSDDETQDAKSRAWEMTTLAVGRELHPHQVDFVQCLRQRLQSSPAAKAFEAAWSQAYERAAAQDTPTPTAIMRKPHSIDDELEHAIAAQVVHGVLCKGYTVSVWEGEDYALKGSTDAGAIMEALASTDSDRLELRREGRLVGSVWLIWGNGCDLVSDYTAKPEVEAALAAAELYAEANAD